MVKNFLALTLLSQGRPMLLMGDEVRRTQRGNNNAYCQDDELSWFDWGDVQTHQDVRRFARGLIHFRGQSPVFHHERFWGEPGSAGLTWHGVQLNAPDWS